MSPSEETKSLQEHTIPDGSVQSFCSTIDVHDYEKVKSDVEAADKSVVEVVHIKGKKVRLVLKEISQDSLMMYINYLRFKSALDAVGLNVVDKKDVKHDDNQYDEEQENLKRKKNQKIFTSFAPNKDQDFLLLTNGKTTRTFYKHGRDCTSKKPIVIKCNCVLKTCEHRKDKEECSCTETYNYSYDQYNIVRGSVYKNQLKNYAMKRKLASIRPADNPMVTRNMFKSAIDKLRNESVAIQRNKLKQKEEKRKRELKEAILNGDNVCLDDGELTEEPVIKKDEDGNPMYDANNKPIYETDKNGNIVTVTKDKDGNVVLKKKQTIDKANKTRSLYSKHATIQMVRSRITLRSDLPESTFINALKEKFGDSIVVNEELLRGRSAKSKSIKDAPCTGSAELNDNDDEDVFEDSDDDNQSGNDINMNSDEKDSNTDECKSFADNDDSESDTEMIEE